MFLPDRSKVWEMIDQLGLRQREVRMRSATVCTGHNAFNNSPWVTCTLPSWISLCFWQIFSLHHSAASPSPSHPLPPPLHSHYLPPHLQSCWFCAALGVVSVTTTGWRASGWYQHLPSSPSTRWTCGCPIKRSGDYNVKLDTHENRQKNIVF